MKKEIVIGLLAVTVIITLGVIYLISNMNQTLTQNNSQSDEEVQGLSDMPENMPENDNTQEEPAQNIGSLDRPEMTIDPQKPYRALLKTSEGEIGIRLFADKTPITVNNFIYLARNDFYDNTVFHRIVQDFMIQGGDPNGDGTGGPGYTFGDEEFEGEYTKGVVAMANRGPNTNGSQFFIMHGDTDLPKDYVIFGEVDYGLSTVDTIALSEVEESFNGEMSKPVNPVVIEEVEIVEE